MTSRKQKIVIMTMGILGYLLVICLGAFGAEENLPEKVKSLAGKVVTIAERNHYIGIPADNQKALQYWDAVSELGGAVETGIYAYISRKKQVNLIEAVSAFSFVYADNPKKKVKELIATYGRPSEYQRLKAAPMPEPLEPRHVTEEYRYAWEALFLSPQTREIRFMQQKRRVDDALAGIGSLQSLPIFVEAFKLSAIHDKVSNKTRYRLCERMLFRLIHFQNTAGLKAILDCLEIAEIEGVRDLNDKDLVQDVINFLRRLKPSDIEHWNLIVSQIDRRSLSLIQDHLLRDLKNGLADL